MLSHCFFVFKSINQCLLILHKIIQKKKLHRFLRCRKKEPVHCEYRKANSFAPIEQMVNSAKFDDNVWFILPINLKKKSPEMMKLVSIEARLGCVHLMCFVQPHTRQVFRFNLHIFITS